jgi:multiple sugar transport system ATP-binding protein
VRVGGEVDLHYGDDIWLSPDTGHLHRFDGQGLRVA